VSVDPGELSNRREANRLLAHEAVHAGSPGSQRDGYGLVHAKMRGTRAALESEHHGQGASSGRFRRLASKIVGQGALTRWDQVLAGVGAYEALEQGLLEKGPPSTPQLNAAKPRLIAQLQRVQLACYAWQEANDQSGAAELAEQWHQNTLNFTPTMEAEEAELYQASDTRTKATRRQSIAMLLPRVQREMADLQQGQWSSTLGFSDAQLVPNKKGETKSGAVNTVNELFYATEQGEFAGYFKADVGFATGNKQTGKGFQSHEALAGIHQADPQYAARAVAMYRIDQLFGAGVTAKTEFAIHNGKFGSVGESAKGSSIGDISFAVSSSHKDQLGPTAVSADDPVLQRGLNKLQLIDAICGQLDRHMGNVYVEVDDQGRVKGVTGIDLDMAFGGKMTRPEGGRGPQARAENYLGLPALVDKEFGERLLTVADDDVRKALKGLLSDAEIEATVSRFGHVKDFVRGLQSKGQLTADWNQATAFASRDKKSALPSAQITYSGKVSAGAVQKAVDDMKQAITRVEAGDGSGPAPFDSKLLGPLNDMPPQTKRSMLGCCAPELRKLIEADIINGVVPTQQAITVAMTAFNELLSDDRLLSRVAVAVQENFSQRDLAVLNHVKPAARQVYRSVVDRLCKQFVLVGS
jgi:hypothetical protein